jgi:dynactin 1
LCQTDKVQIAQRIGAHVAMIRSTKQPLHLSDIETFLAEITAQSSATIAAPPWDLIGMFITKLGNELGEILPKVRQAGKAGQTISSESITCSLSS